MDEAKVQLHLGAKEARDEIQLHVVKLEQEFNQAKEKWRELENVTESAGEDIHRGLKGSLKTMQKSFEKAQQHFQKEVILGRYRPVLFRIEKTQRGSEVELLKKRCRNLSKIPPKKRGNLYAGPYCSIWVSTSTLSRRGEYHGEFEE